MSFAYSCAAYRAIVDFSQIAAFRLGPSRPLQGSSNTRTLLTIKPPIFLDPRVSTGFCQPYLWRTMTKPSAIVLLHTDDKMAPFTQWLAGQRRGETL